MKIYSMVLNFEDQIIVFLREDMKVARVSREKCPYTVNHTLFNDQIYEESTRDEWELAYGKFTEILQNDFPQDERKSDS